MVKLGRIEIEIVEGDVRKSCTFHHSTVRKLLNHIDAIEAEKDQLIDNVAQLKKEYDELMQDHILSVKNADAWQEESYRLTSELEKAYESKKVMLPKDVADEIEYYKFNYASNMWVFELLHSIFSSTTDTQNVRGVVMSELLSALVNGYTVKEEPTTEDKIEVRLEKLLLENKIDSVIPVRELSALLTLAIREILAEDAVKQHEAE